MQNLEYSNHTTPQDQIDSITTLFDSNKVLSNAYNSISVVHSNNLSSIVPKPFFNEDNLAAYLQYTIKVLKNDFITYDTFKNIEMINVYIPSVYLNNFLFDKFGSFDYKHSSTILVENLLKKYTNSESTHFIVNVERDFFQVIILKQKKLEFYNSFNFSTKEDFIYYILFTAEQLHLNPEEFLLTFMGDIEKKSELYSIVYEYIRNINFYEPSYSIKEKFGVPDHSNFVLLNQHS
jgi:hypothetical protein